MTHSSILPREFEHVQKRQRRSWSMFRLRRWLRRQRISRLWGLAALAMFVLSAGAPTGYGG